MVSVLEEIFVGFSLST